MAEYVILTESTSDLSPELIKELSIVVIPMMFSIGEKEYRNYPDERELSAKAFYDFLRAEKTSKTSQITAAEFISTVEPMLKKGKDILYIAFSSGLSGTFGSASVAFEELRGKYPSRTLVCIDSFAASMGEGLLVYHAAKMRANGKNINEVAKWLKKNYMKLCMWFTVDDLNHLKRGGRVSGTTALLGSMLGIKPVLHIDYEGYLVPSEKVRGRKASLEALLRHFQDTAIDVANQAVFISHGDCLQDAKYVEKELRTRFAAKLIYINNIGPVIGSHTGPGTVALFFLGTGTER